MTLSTLIVMPLLVPGASALEWTREYAHATAYVDLRDRTKSKVTWK